MRDEDLSAAAEVEQRSATRPRSEAAMRSDFESNPQAWYCVARLHGESEPVESEPGELKAVESEPVEWEQGEPEPGESEPGEPEAGDSDPGVVGYACLWLLVDVAHVVMIAVRPEWRRQGIGGCLLRRLVERANQLDATSVTLEVRESNGTAMRLYARNGFVEVGRRPGYYPDTHEAAVMMTAPVSTSSAATAPSATTPAR